MIQNINKCVERNDFTIGNNCKKSVGGIKEMSFIPKEGIEYFHFDKDNTDMIDYILLKHQYNFQPIYFLKDSANVTTTYTYDPNTGNANYKTEIKGNISNFAFHNNLGWFVEGGEYVVVYKDMNDWWYVVGLDNPVEVTTYTQTTGSNLGEFNGYEVTFTCDDIEDSLRLVVGREMQYEEGSYSYIPETILQGRMMCWSGVEEIDWGNPDVHFPLGHATDVIGSTVFPLVFRVTDDQESEHIMPTNDTTHNYGLSNEGLDIFSLESIYITGEMCSYIEELSEESEEEKVFTKRLKSYLFYGDNSVLEEPINLTAIADEQIIVTFTDEWTKPNTRCVVIDWELQFKQQPAKSVLHNELGFKIYSFNSVEYDI